MQNRLRIYCGPEETVETAPVAPRPSHVTLPAREIFDWLADAVNNRRAWVRDFQDEEITISQDLYEVVLAYQHFNHRPSA